MTQEAVRELQDVGYGVQGSVFRIYKF